MGIGQAYAVFYCNSSKEEIEAALPAIKEEAHIPETLELSLVEGFNGLKSNPDYLDIVGMAGKVIATAQRNGNNGNLYVMQALYPTSLNHRIRDFIPWLVSEPDISRLFSGFLSSANKLAAQELDTLLQKASSPEYGLFNGEERFDEDVFYKKGEQYTLL